MSHRRWVNQADPDCKGKSIEMLIETIQVPTQSFMVLMFELGFCFVQLLACT